MLVRAWATLTQQLGVAIGTGLKSTTSEERCSLPSAIEAPRVRLGTHDAPCIVSPNGAHPLEMCAVSGLKNPRVRQWQCKSTFGAHHERCIETG